MGNISIIKDFLATVNRNQKEEILDFFTEETIFHNIPMEAVTGKEAIWGVLSLVHEQAERVFWELHNIAESDDGKVLTERTDFFYLPTKTIACKVMGIFEINDGKITYWRDYFDLNQITEQF